MEEHPDAYVAWFSLPSTGQSIALAEPRRTGHDLAEYVAHIGEGIFGIILDVEDLARAKAELDRRASAYHQPDWLHGLPVTNSSIAANTRLVLRQAGAG